MLFHTLCVEWHNNSHKSGNCSTEQLTCTLLNRLQRAVNSAARLVNRFKRREHVRNTFHEMSALAANHDANSNQDHPPTYLSLCIYLTRVTKYVCGTNSGAVVSSRGKASAPWLSGCEALTYLLPLP